MRNPVNDPGPVPTVTAPRAPIASPATPSSSSIAPCNAAPCDVTGRAIDAATLPSAMTARLAIRCAPTLPLGERVHSPRPTTTKNGACRVHDDRRLFEFLILEGAQAGLSWITILKKRAAYRKAFDRFDPRKVARYDAAKVARAAGQRRHRAQSAEGRAAIGNAQAFLAVQKEFGSFDDYIWQFVGGKPVQNRRRAADSFPPAPRNPTP